jgi:hypothetical protein
MMGGVAGSEFGGEDKVDAVRGWGLGGNVEE